MIFQRCFGSEILQGLGNAALLEQRLIAFFASRQCTGAAISAAMDWAVQQATKRNDIVARLAQQIVIGYASPDGELVRSCKKWETAGAIVERLFII
jgi:hypothetical protein